MTGTIFIEKHTLLAPNVEFELSKVVGGYTRFEQVTATGERTVNVGKVQPIDRFKGHLVANCSAYLASGARLQGAQIMGGEVLQDFNPTDSGPGATGRGVECLGLKANGEARVYSAYDGDTAASMAADGVQWTFGFMGAPVRGGEAVDMEGSGRFQDFHFRSARNILGVDKHMNPMLMTVHGHSQTSGIGLNDLAQLCAEFGFYEAINLDGGGSAQAMHRGKVYHRSSDAQGRRLIPSAVVIDV